MAQNPYADTNYFNLAIETTDKDPENYLAPINKLISSKPNSSISSLNNWYEAMMTYYSFLGDYENAALYSDKITLLNNATIKTSAYDSAFVNQHVFVDAIPFITDIAKGYQVTMINEAHHVPFHRAFVLQMLNNFYQNGYRYIAIETLEDSLVNRIYPDYNTGYYTREPLFGELVRQAKKIGFRLLPYESKTPCDGKNKPPLYCSCFRDSIMAKNLTRVFKADPNAKVLVYAGYDHIQEENTDGWKKMAQYFRDFTAIDPLTIDLTKQIEHVDNRLNEREFNAVNNMLHIKAPVIALKNNRPWHNSSVDISVIFPQYLSQGRHPIYNNVGGSRSQYNLDSLHLKPGNFVQAYYASEKIGKRIPADQLIISGAENSLYLYRSNYIIEIKDNFGKLIKKTEVALH